MKLISTFSPTSIERINFRKDIHGLRGLAVISVVFYHSNFELLQGGWLGVDIFFLISGYLISNIIISELNIGKFSFRAFYKRRIRRIIPALLSTLSITTLFSYWLLTPKSLIEYSEAMISSIFFYSNYYFQNLDFYNTEPAKFNPLLHIWTLSVEEQFYVLYPLILIVILPLGANFALTNNKSPTKVNITKRNTTILPKIVSKTGTVFNNIILICFDLII